MPERRWHVTLAEGRVGVVDHTGAAADVAWEEIALVAIETDDSGPWGSDLHWWLHGADGLLRVVWPQGATGEDAVIDALLTLPGFDHEAMVSAMGSTRPAVFVLWRREGEAAEI